MKPQQPITFADVDAILARRGGPTVDELLDRLLQHTDSPAGRRDVPAGPQEGDRPACAARSAARSPTRGCPS
ncbi:hypothetical protein ACFOWE_00100 [Planomonospora corallina]|uniref:Uncharacterized protein n=1 Tax=Planomonospora corallina TaxID=1806052 RepID=A0ABV8I2U3_9ACTN